MNTLLGIDIGTSACKAALFSEDGTVLAQHSAPYPVEHPFPGFAEQDPRQWWKAACMAVREVLGHSSVRAQEIAGIGVDGQSWSAVPIGREGEVLCPTPIWMDTRAQGICRKLQEQFGEERFFSVGGNPLQPSYTLPKVLWYRQERPDIFKKAEKILSCNAYLVYQLCGALTQDLSQCYGYQCFDIRRLQYDDALLSELGIPRNLLPETVPCHQIVGHTTPQAQEACGLPIGIPVVAGGLDAACGTLGAGVLEPGQTQEQGGQAGGMSICTDAPHADPRLILGCHVVPGRWLLQGGTVGGGGVLRWLGDELGAQERLDAAQSGCGLYTQMDRQAESIAPGSDGVLFLPYLAGERSPIWDPMAKGVFYGLDYQKTRAHLYRAALEGTAFALRHNLEAAREAGACCNTLRAMGGAANSRLWTQIKADVTGRCIEVPSADTATTWGAAILAGVAVGIWGSFSEAVQRTVHIRRIHQPDPQRQEIYDRAYRRYRKLYECLGPLMHPADGEECQH